MSECDRNSGGDTTLQLPTHIRLVEVGLRDGLQTVKKQVSTDDKVALAGALVESGVTEIKRFRLRTRRCCRSLSMPSK